MKIIEKTIVNDTTTVIAEETKNDARVLIEIGVVIYTRKTVTYELTLQTTPRCYMGAYDLGCENEVISLGRMIEKRGKLMIESGYKPTSYTLYGDKMPIKVDVKTWNVAIPTIEQLVDSKNPCTHETDTKLPDGNWQDQDGNIGPDCWML